MISLPIASRELLVTARNPMTYRGRMIAAAVIFIFCGGFSILFSSMGRRTGADLLGTFSFYILIYCLSATVQATGDSISREKREGTIGLLFLTPLKSVELVAGKLIAGMLAVYYGLLAGFPMLSLVLLMGGVEGKDLLRLFLATVNAIFFAGCVGLFSSALATNRKLALAGGTWIVLALCVLMPAAATAASFSQQWSWAARPLFALSLPSTIMGSMQMPPGMMKPGFWLPLVGTHLIAWLFFGLAAYFLPRKWREKPAQGKGMPLRERFRQWSYGKPRFRARRREKLLAKNAFLWLAARERTKPMGPWLVLIFSTGIFSWVAHMSGGTIEGWIIPYVIVNSVAFKFMLCGSASQKLLEEKENGTLELLLSTPLSVKEIMHGQLRALWLHARGPFLVQVVLQLGAAAWLLGGTSPAANPEWVLVLGVAGFMIFFVVDFFVIGLVGMWGAMIARNARHAPGAVIVRALILPGLFVFVVTLVTRLTQSIFGWHVALPDDGLVPLYYAASVVNAVFWIKYVLHKLPESMRQLAFERYSAEPPSTFWSKVGKWHGRMRFRPVANPGTF